MRDRRRFLLVGVVTGTALVAILVFTYLPVPHHFEEDGVYFVDPYATCAGLYPTAGTVVNFHWWDRVNVSFAVVSCATNVVVYQADGSSGAGRFLAQGGFYKFGALCGPGFCSPADVSGDYTGPLLVW